MSEAAHKTDMMAWYIIQGQSGFEKKIVAAIEEQAKVKGLVSLIEKIETPSEEVVEVRKGARKTSQRKLFPGYILIHAVMNDEIRHMILQVPKVIDILGGGKGEALPMEEDEMERVNQRVHEGSTRLKTLVSFEVGEQVRVCDGPFASFNGLVESVDEEKARLKVSISIFGRATPVNLDYAQVEKV